MSTESELKTRLDAVEARVKKLEEALLSGPVDSRPKKKLSAKEFLLTKSAAKDTQKLLVLGYYLEHMEQMESFNVSDIEAAFHAAKENPPGNTNATVDRNIAQGFLMPSPNKKDGKKAWCLTSTGEQQVENELHK